ncbi:urea transporter [Streptomyces sp. NPDC093586]|uniref:urea transporter n=1 Tax=Streptomyces sp. NPDC093586 TaxID=3366042 RepID=UPI00380FA4A5
MATCFLTGVSKSPVGGFVDAVLRGVGQVFLQNNPLSGLLFLVGVFLSNCVVGLYALLGVAVSTATALAAGVDRSTVQRGFYGFNGTLTAVGLATYVKHGYALVGYVVLASMAVPVLTAATRDFLSSEHLPTLTAVFVLTAWTFLAGLRQFSHFTGSPAFARPHLPVGTPHTSGALTPSDLLFGFFNGFSQVLLQTGLWTGAAFLVGILVNSRLSAVVAAIGSLIGLGIGWAFGMPAGTLHEGIPGYNAVLTAIALGGLYYLLSLWSAVLAALAAVASVVVYAMFATVLAPIGLPVLTAPFVATTWACIFAAASFTRLRAVHPADAGTPEANLRSTRSSPGKA